MKILVQALEAPLTAQEIKNAVGPEKLKTLKGKGTLTAYTLAHEGKTSPKSLEEGGAVKLSWGRKVIQSLASVVKAGTKFFMGHGKGTNSHNGRRPVGEVVASLTKEIGGRLNHVVIGHFPNDKETSGLDIVSMEAVVDTDIQNNVLSVMEISGVAMGSSDKESPAFPGALRLASIQAYEETTQEVENLKNSPPEKGNTMEKNFSFHEIKRAIQELNVYPHQLFSQEDLKNDRTFGPIFDKMAELEVNNESLKTELGKAQEEVKSIGRKSELFDAKEKFEKMVSGDGFTDKQREFIKAKGKIDSLEDLSETGLTGYLESLKNEYAETARLFGVTEDAGTSGPQGGGQGASGEAADEVDSVVNQILRGE
jgi:hypothetical protein